jgi:hypothetical protein
LDEVRIYAKALSEPEIRALARTSLTLEAKRNPVGNTLEIAVSGYPLTSYSLKSVAALTDTWPSTADQTMLTDSLGNAKFVVPLDNSNNGGRVFRVSR